MSRLLLCVWLASAAFILLLIQSLGGHGLFPHTAVKAKHAMGTDEVVLTLAPVQAGRHIEWVQAARYMAVARAQASTAAPVLFAATYGRPLRLIERDAAFARVQDLGTGQLGWVETRALAPFFGGYRQREATPPIMIADSEAKAGSEALIVAAAPEPVVKVTRPVVRQAVAKPKLKKVAASQNWDGRIFKRNRWGAQRVADRRRVGVAGIMQRTLFGGL
ncbi:MAG: SH3 domain-containing protein [Methyloceanibacter sp.]